MNKDILAAAELLKKNGVNVELPDEKESELQDRISALEAALADRTAPTVHIKPTEGEDAGKRYMFDKFGIDVNTPMNTGLSGGGQELVPSAVLSDKILDLTPQYETFLGDLPGNHGNNLNLTEDVPIIGEDPLFNGGAEVTTDVALTPDAGTHSITTDKVQIVQKQYVATVDLSDFLRKFNVKREAEFDRLITQKLAAGAARTKEAVIINGDTTTAGTGNVNSDNGAPAATSYYLKADGLRKKAIGTTSPDADPDLGTLDLADMRTLENLLGNYFTDPSLCAWITNLKTYNKFKAIDTFNNAATRGETTVFNGKKVTTFDGAPIFISRDYGLTEADGKQNTSAASNTKGGIILLYKPAVQYGTYGDFNFYVYNGGYKGLQLQAWFYFGFAIINQDAGITDTLVANGIDITV